MDKEYIQRLQDMLADADAKIASVDDIEDPTEREIKRSMFLDSRKEIEALLKKVGGSTKKSTAKKATTSKAKKPVVKKAAKAKKPVTKKAAKAKKPVTKKVTKKAEAKKPVAKKVVKKTAAKKASKPVVKKAVKAKKSATKKSTAKKATVSKAKKPVVKKAAKKSAKDTTVKQFTNKPKKTVKKKAPAKKASTSDDARAVFSNASKKDLKEVKKESIKEKKSSAKKEKNIKKSEKASNASQKKVYKESAKTKKEVRADMNADANIYMKPKKEATTTKDIKADEDAVAAFGNDKNEAKVDKKELKRQRKEFEKAQKLEKKQAKLDNKDEKPILESKPQVSEAPASNDKEAIKAANKREKEAKKLAKKQEKEYKKQAKLASKEVNKTVTVNGVEIPEYTDDIAKVRSTSVPEFGSSHSPMTEKELALNTIYASIFSSDVQPEGKTKDAKPISVEAYNDKNYEDAIPQYKDTKSTPTAKVGVEAGPLSNGPVAINPNDKADEVSPNGNSVEPEQAPVKKVKVSKKDKQADEAKPEPAKADVKESVVDVQQVKAAPMENKVDKAAEREAVKAADKRQKEAEKLAKEQAKAYKKSEKLANKKFKKASKINGYEIPEYTDDIAKVRSTSVPEFGSSHPAMTDEELVLNTRYASLFYADSDSKYDKELEDHKPISVGAYDDKNYEDAIQPYKDTKSTPTAKVGVEAGPLSNGPVAINPNDKADEVSPNGNSVEPEQTPVKEAKASKKAKKSYDSKAEPVQTEATSQSEETIDPKKAKKLAKKQEKLARQQAKEEEKLAKKQQREAMERETEMRRKQEEDNFRLAKQKADETAEKQRKELEKQKEKEAEINRLAAEASEKAAKQQKEDQEKAAKETKVAKKTKKQLAAEQKAEEQQASDTDKRIAEQSSKRAEVVKGEFIKVDLPPIPDDGIKSLKQIAKRQKQLTSKYSKQILDGAIVTTTDYKPEVSKHVIELHDVVKSYITGDIETPVLKGVNLKLNKGDFIVILGPSGSGKTTFLNTISGLDKATKGDVFVLGYNLSYLKDSHLTKFRRKHVGFIFQQYNLLTNLTAKENAEVGENLSAYKNPDMTIEDIFETIGMKTQMNKYPHQMSGGQQQRVSIARALAKNPDILFADEPTGALDEEMGRKVLEILVEVNKRYGTTVIVVTHNPNIAKIGNTVIHIRNGKVEEVEANQKPADPATIEWA